MSRIYFHTPSETVEVRGSERAYAGQLAEKLGYSVLENVVGTGRLCELLGILPGDDYPRNLSLQIRYAEEPLLVHGGKEITSWQLLLNTAMAVGNDSVKLLTRLHAQCELHGWVEGKDRNWFASLIEDGLRAGVLRPDMGWDSVVAMLGCSYTEPVVMSYSVMESFPNRFCTAWESPPGAEDIDEAWDCLSDEEKWTHGIAWLQLQRYRLLQWRPSGWQDMRFGHAVSAFDLDKILREKESAR